MFIALEGADGCGKTTLCSLLAKSLGATEYATPPKKYIQLRSRVDKSASAQEHYQFYRDGIYDAADEIGELLKDGTKVVADRYCLTTFTYHQVESATVSWDDFSTIVQPDLTVILALNHEVQVERMLKRGMSIEDRRFLDKQREVTGAFYRNALVFDIPFIAIDTQRFSPEQCVAIVTSALK